MHSAHQFSTRRGQSDRPDRPAHLSLLAPQVRRAEFRSADGLPLEDWLAHRRAAEGWVPVVGAVTVLHRSSGVVRVFEMRPLPLEQGEGAERG